jgi:hypothetical protein
MPQVGEEIDVLVSDPNDRYGTPVYDFGRVERVSQSDCSFEASQRDELLSMSRYEGTNGLIFVPVAAVFGWVFSPTTPEFDRFSNATIALGEKLQADKLQADKKEAITSGGLSVEPPVMASGEYTGDTSESDGVQQSSFTTLDFRRDGRVSGFGFDSEDGKFEIVDGYWFGAKAVWFEQYRAGPKPNSRSSQAAFKVAVQVEYSRKDALLRGTFCSSVRSIKGDFTLRPEEDTTFIMSRLKQLTR